MDEFKLSEEANEKIQRLKESRDRDEYTPDTDKIENYLIDDIITEEIERDMY